MTRRAIVWFRNDLRLTDNPSLLAAMETASEIVPVYVHAPSAHGDWPQGSAARSWLARSLASLDEGLRGRGSRLTIRVGDPEQILPAIAAETRATCLHAARRHGPAFRRVEARVVAHLEGSGLEVHTHETALLRRPDDLRNAQGGPYKVFTAFYHAAERLAPPPTPRPAPGWIPAPEAWPETLSPEALLQPGDDPRLGEDDGWMPGEKAADRRLALFLDELVTGYPERRDEPGVDGTSRLSPYLSFGELGAGQVWHAANRVIGDEAWSERDAGVVEFIRQLYWREFAYHLLVNFPETPTRPLRPEFEAFPWSRHTADSEAWETGRTGYPIVDAGMRQLAKTGWMHNRVRMLVASFLTKDLLVPWLDGARFFWDRLMDADLANNTLGWQWVAGCGADAAPYFRIFNPVLQGERFDPDGIYVSRWVPELADIPRRWIHRPWEAPEDALTTAGVRLGTDYPRPIVDHAEARRRALAAYASTRANG